MERCKCPRCELGTIVGCHMLLDKFAHAKVEMRVHETINEGGPTRRQLPRPAKCEQVQCNETSTETRIHTHTRTPSAVIAIHHYEIYHCVCVFVCVRRAQSGFGQQQQQLSVPFPPLSLSLPLTLLAASIKLPGTCPKTHKSVR